VCNRRGLICHESYRSIFSIPIRILRYGFSVFKSNRPKISPRGVQNEKIENPQSLPGYRSGWTISRKNTVSSIRFLFYANGDKIGLAALTSVSRAPNNALFELRLKINKTVNLATKYLNEKNTCLRTVWNIICPILSQTEFLVDFCFSSIFHSFWRTKKRQNGQGKIAPWYTAWSYIKLIQRKNRVSTSNNYNKIFGLLKMRNFRAPGKSGTNGQNTPFLVTQLGVKNQQCG